MGPCSVDRSDPPAGSPSVRPRGYARTGTGAAGRGRGAPGHSPLRSSFPECCSAGTHVVRTRPHTPQIPITNDPRPWSVAANVHACFKNLRLPRVVPRVGAMGCAGRRSNVKAADVLSGYPRRPIGYHGEAAIRSARAAVMASYPIEWGLGGPIGPMRRGPRLVRWGRTRAAPSSRRSPGRRRPGLSVGSPARKGGSRWYHLALPPRTGRDTLSR
jgi:hypothetical protein